MVVSTILTKSCLKDFLLMKKTCDLYHKGHTYDLACDSFCFSYLNGNYNNVLCTEYPELQEGDHVAGDAESKKRFREIISIKFEHTLGVFARKNPTDVVLWCDVDHIFLNSIEPWVLEDRNSACVTPHYSNGFADEGTVGFYNCGFVFLKDVDFLKEWKRLYDLHEQLGIYYEQKALELACKSFAVTLLPINYNVGWWKFMSSRFENNASQMALAPMRVPSLELDLSLYHLRVINFHFHFFKEDGHSCDKGQLKNFLVSVLQQRRRPEDLITLGEMERLKNENI